MRWGGFLASGAVLGLGLVIATGCGDGASKPGLVGSPAPSSTPGATPTPTPAPCTISREQVLDPTLPTEVANGEDASLCDFNVFAWESFLYLVSPSSTDPSTRRFLVDADFPQYLGQGEDSCGDSPGLEFVVRSVAAPSPDVEAGSDAVVYSVTGDSSSGDDLVLYNIRFREDLCTDTGANLPSDLIEIKTAWRFLGDSDDSSRYFTQSVDFDGETVTLGLIGFHLAQATEDHPEMIWSTWEHVDNVPDCQAGDSAPARPAAGWTMTTDDCATCLVSMASTDCTTACTTTDSAFSSSTSGLNDGFTVSDPSEIPANAQSTNVCRVFPQGTHDGDVESSQNRANVISLNGQIIGSDGYLTSLADTDPQAIWQYYEMVGGIWFDFDGSTPPGGSNSSLQRGSIQLANSVMETTYQGSFSVQSGSTANGLNCFGCHQASDYAETRSSQLSHIAAYVNGGS